MLSYSIEKDFDMVKRCMKLLVKKDVASQDELKQYDYNKDGIISMSDLYNVFKIYNGEKAPFYFKQNELHIETDLLVGKFMGAIITFEDDISIDVHLDNSQWYTTSFGKILYIENLEAHDIIEHIGTTHGDNVVTNFEIVSIHDREYYYTKFK
jgi:hypothetical protein